MKIRDPMRFVANPEISSSIGCKSQSVLRVLRLTALFAALAFTPCLAEEANNAGAGPAATVSMEHNTFIPGEITVVPGTTVTWVNKEAMPHTVVDINKGFRSKTLRQGHEFLFHFCNRGRL